MCISIRSVRNATEASEDELKVEHNLNAVYSCQLNKSESKETWNLLNSLSTGVVRGNMDHFLGVFKLNL